jgi:hypothetical protein
MAIRLYHGGVLLGNITNIGQEGVWMSGTVRLTQEGSAYGDFFSYMTDESKGLEDPPFGRDLLDPNNWFIEDERGMRRGIEVPAVHDDNSIEWRWK